MAVAPGVSSAELSKIKVIFLGASGVGKTTVITKFIDRCFVESSIPTIGIDFTGKTIMVDGRPVRIQIWDTAGQERFHSLIPSYVREARGAVVMYDVTSRDSFMEVPKWIDLVRKKSTVDAAIIVCGNKCDKEDREVKSSEAEALCTELKVLFCETSARNGQNIGSLFERVTRQALVMPRALEPAWEEAVVLKTTTTREQSKAGCAC